MSHRMFVLADQYVVDERFVEIVARLMDVYRDSERIVAIYETR